MATEHVDVLIVGAGLSGIGAACHLEAESPGRTYAILEARDAIGGTWDLFRYPGVRSDSDLHTFGYEFKPWRDEQSIAGTSVTAVAPLPITTTRLPVWSRSAGHCCGCTIGPVNRSSPGNSGRKPSSYR